MSIEQKKNGIIKLIRVLSTTLNELQDATTDPIEHDQIQAAMGNLESIKGIIGQVAPQHFGTPRRNQAQYHRTQARVHAFLNNLYYPEAI